MTLSKTLISAMDDLYKEVLEHANDSGTTSKDFREGYILGFEQANLAMTMLILDYYQEEE